MNDTFRKEYTPLSDEQKAEMLAIKEKAEELEALYVKAVGRNPRLIAIAKTELEASVMWAVKAVTTVSGGASIGNSAPGVGGQGAGTPGQA